MMKLFFHAPLWLILAWSPALRAQTCSQPDYYLQDQAAVEALGAEACSHITGYLKIRWEYIDNVDALSSIVSVDDYVEFVSTALTNIDGLANLETIGGDLIIVNNANLANVDGLSALTHVGKDVSVTQNPSLIDVEGLSSLASLRGLRIDNNPAVTTLPTFGSLTTLGYLDISHMDGLSHIDGLSGVAALSWAGLTLAGNDSLSNVDGLIGLNSVVGDVLVVGNDSLSALDGLASLSSVGGEVRINQNSELTNIDGLSNLSEAGSVLVYGNDSLTQIDGFAGLMSVGGVEVLSNSALQNIDGFMGLDTINGNLAIESNQSLVNVDGLSDLQIISGGLYIARNHHLANIDGLIMLTHVGGSLTLTSTQITDVDGLMGLQTVGEHLGLYHNYSLGDLDGLVNLESVGTDLILSDNPALSDCEALASVLGYPDGSDVSIGGALQVTLPIYTPDGCRSVDQIFESVVLPTPPSIVGAVVGNGFADISFRASEVQSDVFPVTRYVAQCAGSEEQATKGPAVISPALEKTEVAASLSGFGDHLAKTRFIIWYDIEHERPDLLTVTLLSPSGNRYVLRDGTGAPETRFKEVAYVNPPDYEPPPGETPGFIFADPPEDISGLVNEVIEGEWILEVVNAEGPVFREGVLHEFDIRVQESPIATFNLGCGIYSENSYCTMRMEQLIYGRGYSCRVFPETRFGIQWDGSPEYFDLPTMGTPPAGVSIKNIEYEDGTLIVYVSVAEDYGFLFYTQVVCEGGPVPLTGSASGAAVRVPGAVDGETYNCSATALNNFGVSQSSPVSDPFTAEWLPTGGLPAWLLYEATR